MRKIVAGLFGFAMLLALTAPATAGDIALTGHDVFFHSGQNNLDDTLLNALRGSTPAASYNILFLRETDIGSQKTDFTDAGFPATTVIDISTRYGNPATRVANFLADIAGKQVIIIGDHSGCGGCSLVDSSADILEALRPQIADFFNAGGDIFSGTGDGDTTFFNFLPPGAASSGLPIGGSSGFDCTAAGAAIGITGGASCPGPSMINGFPTHNRFTTFDSDFQVLEVRGTEVITLLLVGGRIVDEGIVTDDGGTDGGTGVPGPAAVALLGLGLASLAALSRRRR